MKDGVWKPEYEKWRHGGWYVMNITHPNGGCGCVSCNYTDKKWRIVCCESAGTFSSRDAAAHAERAIALADRLDLLAKRLDEFGVTLLPKEDAAQAFALRNFALGKAGA